MDVRQRIRSFLARRKVMAELDEELAFHVEQETAAHIERGRSPAEARRLALRDLGGLTQTRENVRHVRTAWGDAVHRGLMHMGRMIRRHPGLSGLASLAMSLSIAATLVIVTLVDALWIRPQPVTAPDGVVLVTRDVSAEGSGDTASWAAFGLRRLTESGAFVAVAGQVQNTARDGAFAPHVFVDGIARPLETLGVTADYFSLLGVGIRGRDFTRGDDGPGAESVAIVSDRLWKSAFGARVDVVGAIVNTRPVPLRIVGIASPDFRGALRGERTDLWIPASLVSRLVGAPESDPAPLTALARLQPGVSADTADELVVQSYPGRGRIGPVRVIPLSRVFGAPNHKTIVIAEGPIVWVLGFTAGLVFLGGCMTVAALVLVHYERRRMEFTVRRALGASRGALAGQLMLEVGLLASAGFAGAVLLATWSLAGLASFNWSGGVDLGRLNLDLDWRVIGVGVAASVVTMAGASLLPILRLTRAAEGMALAGSGPTATASSLRTRQFMLGVHVAATVVVLIAAGLFVRTIDYAFSQGTGFDTDHTVFVDLQAKHLFQTSQDDLDTATSRRAAALARLLDDVRSLPGVESAAVGEAPIGPDQAWRSREDVDVDVDGDPRRLRVSTVDVDPGYLDAVGAVMLAGRPLNSQDVTSSGSGAVVITASLSDELWPGELPIGHRLIHPGHFRIEQTVVGVIQDIAYGSVLSGSAVVFKATSAEMAARSEHVGLVIRTAYPARLDGPLRLAAAQVFPDAARIDVMTGRALVERDIGRQRLGAWFFSGFGVVALALGVCGVFGLVAYLVESRRREFGIRMALGATSDAVMRSALGAGLGPVVTGTAFGVVGASLFAKGLDALLVGVSGLDAKVYVAAGVLMVAAASVAAVAACLGLRRLPLVSILRAE